jgi:uncharacterized membrane protein YbhN (UPF0104 family)
MAFSLKAMLRNAAGPLRAAVTCITIYLLFNLYQPSEVARLASEVGVTALSAALLIYALCVHISAWKWGVLLESVPYRIRMRAVLASCFYSTLPSGQLGGELSKVLIVRASHPHADNVLATVVFDKLTGVMGLLLIGLLSFSLSDVYRTHWGMALIIPGVAACGVPLLAARGLATFIVRMKVSSNALQGMQLRASHFLGHIAEFSRNRAILMRSISLGIASQATVILVYLFIAEGIGIRLSTTDMVSAVVLANLATLLPISIAGFGVREAGLTAILVSQHGIHGEKAFALSLTAMAIFLLPAIAGAMIEAGKIIGTRSRKDPPDH